MNAGARQYPGATYSNSKNCGNVENSYNTKFENCNISLPDEKRKVLEWLSPLASRERHQAIRDARADVVGDWLLCNQSFCAWRTAGDKVAKPVLFCYGDPGVGKTYISSLVIDTLSKGIDADDVAVTYVYCDFSARNTQSSSTVLGSVLRQVVGALAEIPGEVQKAFDRAKRQTDGCRPLLPEIREMLIKYLPCLKRVFICIDALDEFPTRGRPELWESLQRVVLGCPNARLFLTGRPHIRDGVRKYFPRTTEMLPISTRQRDIELYLRMRLDRDPESDVMDEELRAEILRVIPERISRIFLLVCINIDAILAEPTIYKRKQALHRMASGSGLQEAYSTTLGRIRHQGGSKSELGMKALMWISHCERPLRSEELRHALGVELGAEDFNYRNVPSIQTILSCALGLITIDEEASTVRLLHLTLQEYLAEHPTLFATAHSMMAEICLTYLSYQPAPEQQLGPGEVLGTTTFLGYATCHWGTHAARGVTEPVRSLALAVLDGYENHISADILWRKKIRKWHLTEDVQGISGLHCIAFWGIAEIAIAMLEMKRWDANGRDSWGNTPLLWAVKFGNDSVVELLLKQEDIEPDMVVQDGRTVLSFAAESGNEGVVRLLLGRGDINPNSSGIHRRTPLSLAASKGHSGVVKQLLEHKYVNPDSSDNDGRTPLSYAAGGGREDLVKLLLERTDVNPNSLDNSGWGALSHASLGGHAGVVKLLLERGDVHPDSPDSTGRTPLSFAASGGHEGVVKLFLERRDVNPNSLDANSRPPLLYAGSRGHEGVVKLLVENPGIDPTSSDNNGLTPLSYAAKWGRDDLVRLFLQREGINPDPLDNKGRTPLSYAASGGHGGVVEQLLQCKDVNPNSVDHNGRPSLSYAAAGGHKSIVKLLVECRDIDPSSSDSNGLTPLSYAAKWGREDLVKSFLEHGRVNPNSLDSSGRTPLSFAASKGHGGVVKLLLERGNVNPNLVDNSGRPPLSYAAAGGYKGVVKLLVENWEIDPNSSDSNGLTPLSYAAKWGHEDLVKLFLQRGGTNPDSSDTRRRTPLSYASSKGHTGVVRLFLGCENVDPDSRDSNGRTPLSFAAEWGREDVVKLLLEREDFNPSSLDNDGRPPLSYAASRGHEGVVRLLVENMDIDPSSSDSCGLTPLLYAAKWGREDLAKRFLPLADANPDSLHNSGRESLPHATLRWRERAGKLASGSTSSNYQSLENLGRMPAPVTGESASRQVTRAPTAPEDVTLPIIDDPPLNLPIPGSVLGPPQEHPLLLYQRPPDQPFLPVAPPTPIPALCSGLVLLSLFLIVFLLLPLLMYFRYGDSSRLFHATRGAWW